MSVPWICADQFLAPGDDLVSCIDARREVDGVRYSLPDRVDVRGFKCRRPAHSHADAAAVKVAGADHDQVRAGRPNLFLDLLLGAGSECDHGDHRRHADDHAQHRESGSHLVPREGLQCDTEDDDDMHGDSLAVFGDRHGRIH